MSNIKQLIFTSTPIGLEPGRSGYCTVARSQDLSKKEIREIERLSVLDYSISKSSPPKVYSFRTIQTKSSFYYLLSRIKSCGVDYSNRTNYIAHHLIIEPESIKDLPSPSEIFQYWEGWKDNWDGNPKYLHDDLFSELSKLKPENQTSCNSWQVWTGDSKNAKILLKGHSIFRTQKNEEDKLINLFSESCSNFGQKENSWNYTFTTFLQPTDDSVDFIWIGGWKNSPADKIDITPEINFFDLDRFDDSLIHETIQFDTNEVSEKENTLTLEIEDNDTKIESEIKDTYQIDEPNIRESSILEESINEEEPAIPTSVKSKETTDASSWKPEQQEPIYKPVENVPIEQSNEQITEETQRAKSLTKSDLNEKPPKVSVKTIKPLSRTQKSKDLSIQKKKNLNVTPGNQFPIITIPFFIVSFVLFCVIFFLWGKVNELEKQNDQLNGLIKKFFEPSSKGFSNNSPPISSTGPFDIPGQSRANPMLTKEEISNNFIAGGNNVTTQVIEQIDESIAKDHSKIEKNLISNEPQIPDLQDNGLGVTPRISERISLKETSNIIENSENKFDKLTAKKGLPINVFDSDYDTFFETPDLLSTDSYQGFVTIIFEFWYTLQKGKLEITFKISESRGGRSVQVLREDNQKIDSWETLPFGNLPAGNIKQTHSISITDDYSIKGIRLSYGGRSSFKQTLRVYEIKGSWKKSAFPLPEITTTPLPNDLPDLPIINPIDNPKPPRPPGFRTWTNKNGIKITAKLIQVYKDKIKIKRIDGAEFISKISAFSKEDQEFVKNIKEKQANIQVRPPPVPLVNKPKPNPVNRPNPKFNDYPKGLHDRTWTDKGGNKTQAYVWGYVPEADAICLVKKTPDGPNILYPKISEMAFSAADENYLKAFTAWRESVLRPYREKLPEMVRIPAGKFLMGSPPFEVGRKTDETQHEVTISNDFHMGKYKVTQGEWLTVMGNSIDAQSRAGIIKTPKELNGPWYSDYKSISSSVLKDYVGKFYEKTPVRAWYGYARQYCDKLTEIHRQNGLIGKDLVFRLPTEAEWEYALRAGTTTAYFWGNNRSDGEPFGLNYRSSSNQLPDNVGSIGKANPWGLFDICMSSEFILDNPRNYSQGGAAFNRSKIDPIGIITSIPKLRGGGGWVIRRDNSRLGYSSSLTLPSGVGYNKKGYKRSGERPETGLANFRIVLAKPIK